VSLISSLNSRVAPVSVELPLRGPLGKNYFLEKLVCHFWVKSPQLLVHLDHLGALSLPSVGETQVVPCLGIVALQPDGFPKGLTASWYCPELW
jgi:hypothetical protein